MVLSPSPLPFIISPHPFPPLRLVEQGKHDELMSKGETGEYASLVKMQLAAGEAGEEAKGVSGNLHAMSR